MSSKDTDPLTYRESGVDIDAGKRAVELMKEHVRSTYRSEVMGELGGFGGLFRLKSSKRGPQVLVAATDGVGSKLKLAFMTGCHDTIGIDCVAMNVNDIATTGAEPLFFLDYLGVGRVDPEVTADIVKGLAAGCREAGCALIGGETAELPDFYAPEEYELAGFAVGVTTEEELIDGSRVKPGMVMLGLHSSGLHSNGFTLVRKALFDVAGFDVDDTVQELGCTVGEELLRPTRIYVRALKAVQEVADPCALVHVTGGGLVENIPRILPDKCSARIDTAAWERPPVFGVVQRAGSIEEQELWRTFNMGIGMVVILEASAVDRVKRRLETLRLSSTILGEVTAEEGGQRVQLN